MLSVVDNALREGHLSKSPGHDSGGKPPITRRSSFTTRALPTFKFSAALEEAAGSKREDQWTLEEWRLHIKKIFNHTKFGKYYENAVIFLSLVSCLEYIYETYLHKDQPSDQSQLRALKIVEVVFASVFGTDWCLSLFLAEHRILFLMSFYSVVDLMTVIPIFITFSNDLPNVNYIKTLPEALLYTAFAMNTTRILRALRIRRKLARVQDAVERFMGELVLSIIVMILFFASVMQFLEYTYQPHDYHTWMYYIWVTISTVGYGDITPMSTQGRVAVMCIIGFSIISIPKMTNELIEKIALQSVYMRNSYTPKTKQSKHVVICGDIASTSLNEFFEELFHEDHQNTDLNAIMLLPCAPTTEMIILLRDSMFFLNLMYLEGSALLDKDLKRAKAHSAVAIFIMTNKFSNRPDEEDAKSILLNLSIKRYVASFSLPPKLFCLQLIRPQNRRHLAREEGDEMSALDLVVCLNEIKMGVLAKAVMYPGSNTLLMNLISSFSDDPVEADGDDDQPAVPMSTDSGKTMLQVSSQAWRQEYQKGCDWEIYTTPLAKVFEGAKFSELSYALYEKVGVVLFALQITDAKVEGASKLLLNPANFIIPSQDLFLIEAFVIAQNKASSDLSFSTAKLDAAQQAIRNIEAGFHQLQRVNRNISSLGGLRKTQRDVDSSKLEALRNRMNGTSNGSPEPGNGSPGEVKIAPEAVKSASSRWKSLKRKNLVAKKVESFSYQEILHQLEDQHMKREYYLRSTPADFTSCVVRTNVIEEIPFINNHVIIIGKGLNNLLDLVRPLRAKFLGLLRYIVIISPEDIPHDVWTKISLFDAILVVRGSPLEEANLRRAGIFRAAQVVVLADGNDQARAAGAGLEALVDSDAIFSYQLVKRMNPETQIVVEIVNTSNISYLETDSSTTVENYKFSPQFAAGNLFTTSLLDSIVCQAYYNPSIIKVLNKLISGVDNVEAAELAAEATARVASQSGEGAIVAVEKPKESDSDSDDSDDSDTFDVNGRTPKKSQVKMPLPAQQGHGRPSQIGMNFAKVESTKRIKDIQGSCLYQMSIPENFNERTYGKLYQRLSAQGIIPLGILRGTFSGMAMGPKANRAPYVYTNPDKDVELFKCDKIFVLSPKPLQIDNKLDLKDWLLNMQQSKALQAADAANPTKRPGSAAMTLEALDVTQRKLDARMSKMNKDMARKLDGMMKMITKLADSNGIRRNTETEDDMEGYYTLDENGKRRFSSESINSMDSFQRQNSGAYSSRSRAETASSTRAMPRTSFRPSIDSASDREKSLIPEKSKSLSKIMQSPNGIMRKTASGDGGSSAKKRHSFSDPIATIKMIGNSPKGSFGPGLGAYAEGPGSPLTQKERNDLMCEEEEDEGDDSLVSSAAPSPETIPTRAPPLGLRFAAQVSPRKESPKASPRSDAAPKYASPRVVPLDTDTIPNTTQTNKNDNDATLSLNMKKYKELALLEESKQPAEEDEIAVINSTSRSAESDSSTINNSPQHSPHHFYQRSSTDELNQLLPGGTRLKPTQSASSPHFTPIKSKKLRVFSPVDSVTLSGPPIELAHAAMHQSRVEKARAASAGRALRGL